MTRERRGWWPAIRRVWVRAGLASLLALPVYAWWTYAPRLDPAVLVSDAQVVVSRNGSTLRFDPRSPRRGAGLVWVTGCLVPAEAYAPLARAVARDGTPVLVYQLPWRCAPLPAHQAQVLTDLRTLMTAPGSRWVLGGHSKGAVFVSALAAVPPPALRGIVLAGTTHPRDVDLSATRLVVAKVVATQDGIAPAPTSEARRGLLPPGALWHVVDGGNHSQFGWYGTQLGDGRATIDRARQQAIVVDVVLDVLRRVDAEDTGETQK
jgi:hypothetical protein